MEKGAILLHAPGTTPKDIVTNITKKHGQIKFKGCTVKIPARINLMCFNVGTLSQHYGTGDYRAGELTIAIDKMTTVIVEVVKDQNSEPIIDCAEQHGRVDLVKHAALITCNYLGLKPHLKIAVQSHRFKHAGLGSSNAIITGVITAINSLCVPNFSYRDCLTMACRHHAEEGDYPGQIVHVQANGAIPALAYYGGGMHVLIGQGHSLYRRHIDTRQYQVVIAMPGFYNNRSAEELMSIESSTFKDMNNNSKVHAETIAYRVLHGLLPAVIEGDYAKIGAIVDYYRFETGSLKVDSALWPGLEELFLKLRSLRSNDTPILCTSSCGPLVFALTKKREEVEKRLRNEGMEIIDCRLYNRGFEMDYLK